VKLTTRLMTAIILCATALSADVIYLKNGKQIECLTAWEEGKEVRYKISSGTVGILRSLVEKIVKSDPTAPEVPALPPPSGGVPVTEIDQQTKHDLARFYVDRGKELVDKRDFAGAVEKFEKAYSYEKNEATALYLAIAYFLAKDDWNAELNFREVLRRNPENLIALNYMGDLNWRKEELDEARRYWEKALTVKDDPSIRKKLGKLESEKSASSGFDSESTGHFLIKYDGGIADESLAIAIADHLESAYRFLSSQYEIYPDRPFVVVLYPRQDYFNFMDVPAWSSGFNDGKIKLPIKGLSSLNEELKGVLIHELSHSFVDLKTSRNSPGWLHEGLAGYSEGKRTPFEASEMLKNLLATGSLPPFSRLRGSFAGANSQSASVLYVQSLSFVEYLIDRFRFYEMNRFLDRIGQHQGLESAFEDTFGATLSEMERQWKTELTSEE